MDATPSFKSESIDIQSFMSEVLFILLCNLSLCGYNSALENETLYFEHLFQYYNNRVIISSENKPLNVIKGSDMHLHSITGTCSTSF
jgi:hypothetical protein